jgi:aminoglycoside phosphotransferase (APT) family kinase protein
MVTRMLDDIAPLMAVVPPGLELDTFADDFGGWEKWLSYVLDRDGGSDWLDTVAELASESIERCTGSGMAHLDLRDDNILVGRDGRVWICDWNFPMLGAPWIDLVTVLLSASGDGFDVEPIVAEHSLTRDVDPRSLDALLANLWLYFAHAQDQPVPRHSPHLRDHQRWYGEACTGWLRHRIADAQNGR